jgi:hypothetical protein
MDSEEEMISSVAEVAATDYRKVFELIVADPRYQTNLDWGERRSGHPEGTVRAHIAEIERNLNALRSNLSEPDYWKLKVLVHTHDSFKPDAKQGAPITHPRSHASLARAFLAEFCNDEDLLAMVQYHDEPYALWRHAKAKGSCNRQRLIALLGRIKDWNLFLAFCIIDGCTEGKSREPLCWLLEQVADKVESRFTAADIL